MYDIYHYICHVRTGAVLTNGPRSDCLLVLTNHLRIFYHLEHKPQISWSSSWTTFHTKMSRCDTERYGKQVIAIIIGSQIVSAAPESSPSSFLAQSSFGALVHWVSSSRLQNTFTLTFPVRATRWGAFTQGRTGSHNFSFQQTVEWEGAFIKLYFTLSPAPAPLPGIDSLN